MPETNAILAQRAWDQLAIIGGAVVRDDTMTFEGTKWNIPAVYRDDVLEGARELARYAEAQQEMIVSQRTFKYRPYDGAYATYRTLKDVFGFVQSKSSRANPPSEVNISIGWTDGPPDAQGKATRIEQRINVPFGSDMVLPGLPGGRLNIGQTRDGKLFHLIATHRRCDEDRVKGFFDAVQRFLDEHSIYRGKCFNPQGEFIDTAKINPDLFVYTEQVWADAETFIFSVMRDRLLLRQAGFQPKRAVLLAGAFGGGKTGLGKTGALSAVANGWSALMCAVTDDPFAALELARIYAPCFVFYEDIDQVASLRDEKAISRLLDVIDGAEAKDAEVLAVMTTNHIEKIPAGMMRPGRFDRVIEIGAMDRPGVEKLARIVCRDGLAPDVDFDAVFAATEGYMPAFVREGLEGAVRYSISRNQAIKDISTVDLVHSLNSLRVQHNMLLDAMGYKVELPPLDQVFKEMIDDTVSGISVNADIDYQSIGDAVDSVVENRINGATLIHIESGDERFEVRTQ